MLIAGHLYGVDHGAGRAFALRTEWHLHRGPEAGQWLASQSAAEPIPGARFVSPTRRQRNVVSDHAVIGNRSVVSHLQRWGH
jgi:hypothetical protein